MVTDFNRHFKIPCRKSYSGKLSLKYGKCGKPNRKMFHNDYFQLVVIYC